MATNLCKTVFPVGSFWVPDCWLSTLLTKKEDGALKPCLWFFKIQVSWIHSIYLPKVWWLFDYLIICVPGRTTVQRFKAHHVICIYNYICIMSLQPHNHTWHCVQNSNHQQSPTMLLSCLLMFSPGTPFISFHFCRCSLGFARASEQTDKIWHINLPHWYIPLIGMLHKTKQPFILATAACLPIKYATIMHQCIKKILCIFSSKHFRNVYILYIYIILYTYMLFWFFHACSVSSGSCSIAACQHQTRWTSN